MLSTPSPYATIFENAVVPPIPALATPMGFQAGSRSRSPMVPASGSGCSSGRGETSGASHVQADDGVGLNRRPRNPRGHHDQSDHQEYTNRSSHRHDPHLPTYRPPTPVFFHKIPPSFSKCLWRGEMRWANPPCVGCGVEPRAPLTGTTLGLSQASRAIGLLAVGWCRDDTRPTRPRSPVCR